MGFFQLPFGVRVAGGEPIDGDRYISINITARDLHIPQGRAFEGLQCYVESDQTLYILKGATNGDWVPIAAGGDLTFLFTQAAPLLVWTLAHNMGKKPSVSILDGSDNEVEGFVHHVDDNNLTITFNAAFSGTATLN